MRTLHYRIKHFGVHAGQSPSDQRSTILLNEITVVLLLIQSLVYFDFLLGAQSIIYLWVPIVTQLATCLPLVLNYFNKTSAAKWYFNIGLSIFMTLLVISHGWELRADYAYLVFPITIVIFFDKVWEYLVQFGVLIGLYLFAHHCINNYEPILSHIVLPQHGIIIYVGMLSSAALIVGRFKNESFNYQQKISNNLEELQNKQIKIEEQNKALEVANTELERFAYISSHNLKTPIRTIKSFSDLIERKIKKGQTEELGEYISFVKQGAEQMHLLVTDILEFSQLNETEKISTEEVDILDVIRFIYVLIKDNSDRNVEIEFANLPSIYTNRSFINSIFQNLIENAVKYNDNDTVCIKIKYELKDGHHLFSVKDNGIGIAPEFHEKVFRMFERLHNNQSYKGTGIGLAMTKKMVERLGGEISLSSSPGTGSTFYVLLPGAVLSDEEDVEESIQEMYD